jgi:hypothetical protein
VTTTAPAVCRPSTLPHPVALPLGAALHLPCHRAARHPAGHPLFPPRSRRRRVPSRRPLRPHAAAQQHHSRSRRSRHPANLPSPHGCRTSASPCSASTFSAAASPAAPSITRCANACPPTIDAHPFSPHPFPTHGPCRILARPLPLPRMRRHPARLHRRRNHRHRPLSRPRILRLPAPRLLHRGMEKLPETPRNRSPSGKPNSAHPPATKPRTLSKNSVRRKFSSASFRKMRTTRKTPATSSP